MLFFCKFCKFCQNFADPMFPFSIFISLFSNRSSSQISRFQLENLAVVEKRVFTCKDRCRYSQKRAASCRNFADRPSCRISFPPRPRRRPTSGKLTRSMQYTTSNRTEELIEEFTECTFQKTPRNIVAIGQRENRKY